MGAQAGQVSYKDKERHDFDGWCGQSKGALRRSMVLDESLYTVLVSIDVRADGRFHDARRDGHGGDIRGKGAVGLARNENRDDWLVFFHCNVYRGYYLALIALLFEWFDAPCLPSSHVAITPPNSDTCSRELSRHLFSINQGHRARGIHSEPCIFFNKC